MADEQERAIQINEISSTSQMADLFLDDEVQDVNQPVQSCEISSTGIDLDAIEDLPIIIIDDWYGSVGELATKKALFRANQKFNYKEFKEEF